MDIENIENTTRSRRAILAGGLGGITALIFDAVGRPRAARAADGEPLILGQSNEAESTTSLAVSPGDAPAVSLTRVGDGTVLRVAGGLLETNDGTGVSAWGATVGVFGESHGRGVRGSGSTGVYGSGDLRGVEGWAMEGAGVAGASTKGAGVRGSSDTGPGVRGQSRDSSGVFGFHGGSSDPAVRLRTGVYGRTISGAADSRGVVGSAVAGSGVAGDSESGAGVRGVSSTGDGGYFKSTSGNGLSVDGRVRFNRSGSLTVPAGQASATKTGIALSSASLVLATMQQRRAGVHLEAVVPDPANSRFRVHLNKPVPANTKVAWFVIR